MVGRFGGSVEVSRMGVLTGCDQRFTSFVVSFQSHEMATAFLFRYEAVATRRLGVILTAGLARISATQRGDGRYSFFSPANFETKVSAMANVFGADLAAPVGSLRFIVPVRVMRAAERLTQGGDDRSGTSASGWALLFDSRARCCSRAQWRAGRPFLRHRLLARHARHGRMRRRLADVTLVLVSHVSVSR
jgi:hypothetical protein